MKLAATVMLTLMLGVPSAAIHAQEGSDDGSKTIVLTDPDHPLNGAWRYTHAAGTVVCPTMTMPIPPSKPEVLRITVHDAGARLEMTAQAGAMTLHRVTADEWASEVDGDRQVLRRKLRDDANWIAWALGDGVTVYEGSQRPGADLLIRYIMSWEHDKPGLLRGYITSTYSGCKIHRSFQMNRTG